MTAARLAAWTGAAMLVLGGHGAAALWVMHSRADPPAAAGQPISVDIVPPPPAPAFSVPQSELALSGPPAIRPAPAPEPEPEPTPQIADAALPRVEMPPIAQLPTFDAAALLPPRVSSERPIARPARRQPQRTAEPARQPETPRKATSVERRPQPQQAAVAPAPAAVAPAPAAVAPAAGAKAQASWRASASAVITRHMQRGRYRTRGPVSATISMTVDGSGRISGASASSGMGGSLDAALTRQIRRLARVPAPPGGRPLPVVVPVRIVH